MFWSKRENKIQIKESAETGNDLPHSCLTDNPVNFMDEDRLNSKQYARALSKFIRNADTPVTLGIQGGWGSGKTSMFSLLKRLLEEPKQLDRHGKVNEKYAEEIKVFQANPTVSITINAWEHSLFQNETNKASVVLSILSSLVSSITALGKTGLLDAESVKKLGDNFSVADITGTLRKFMPAILNLGMQFFVPGAVIPQSKPEEKTTEEQPPVLAEQIHSLKEKLTRFISCLKYKGTPVKVVIFIDDLDRVPPPTAVEILDVTKNIFDIKNCVFVLAIDYDVIVKGLEKKFGERTEKNEREFRQYFDKIIQIPFTMPIGAFSRQIDNMLRNALARLDYKFSETEEQNILTTLAKACRLATGGLPRSLKRIVNTFSLLDYIAGERNSDTDNFDKRINLEARFIIVALHINFPEIFRCIMERPDFTLWKLQELEIPWDLNYSKNENQLESLSQSRVQTYFDEEWEKIIFCLCSKSDWLKHNAINISRLVNLLRDVLEQSANPEEDRNGEARELSDQSVEILRQLIESIRVISIDNELQTGEIGGSTAQQRIFTDFARKLAEQIHSQLPVLPFQERFEKITAELEEGHWNWSAQLDDDIFSLDFDWYPEDEIFLISWNASRHGLKKADAENLLEEQISEPFISGTWGGGKNACFWTGMEIESFDQKKFAQDGVISSIVDKTIEAYKITKKASVKMRKLTE